MQFSRLVMACLTPLVLAAEVDREASLSAVQKLQRLADGSFESGSSVELLEDEMNAFLRFHAADQIPEEVEDPQLSFRHGGAVVRARVDLEKAAESAGNVPALMRLFLRGTRSVALDVDYAASDGYATARVVSLTVDDLELSGSMLDWFVDSLAPPALRPYLLGDKTELDAGASEIRLEPGRAVIVAE